MNSQDGAVCGGPGDGVKDLPPGGNAALGGYWGADVGGISGDEARVVPDQNEGTGESGDATLGICSHSVIAMDGMLLAVPAEKLPRSSSLSGLNGLANWVSTVNGGGLCQSKLGGVAAMRFWSMDSMPCIGAFT